MEVRGRNLVTDVPKTVTVTSSETEEALKETTSDCVEAVIVRYWKEHHRIISGYFWIEELF